MTADDEPRGGIGHRVRAARKLAGITQAQLADRAHVSTSLVKQVEQVRVPASPAFVAAVARALEMPAADAFRAEHAWRADRAPPDRPRPRPPVAR